MTMPDDSIEIIQAHEVTIADAVKPELKKFDKYEARLSELKEQYSAIKIAGIEDRDGYADAKEAVRVLRTMRSDTEDDRKEGKKFYLACGRAIDDKAGWIETEILKLETPIKEQIKAIDDEKEKKKQEKIKSDAARLKIRTEELMKMGVSFDGTSYILGDVSYELSIIRETDEDIYHDEIFLAYVEVFNQNEKIRLEKERIVKELADKAAKEKEDFEKAQRELEEKQRKLKEEQDKIEAQKKEAADNLEREERQKADAVKKEKEAKIRSRHNDLIGMGMVYDFEEDLWIYDGGMPLPAHYVELEDDKWNEAMKIMQAHISDVKEDKKKQLAEQLKKEQEAAVQKALEAKKEQDRQDELKRQQEIELSGDKIKWQDTMDHLKKTPLHDMRSSQYRTKMRELRDFLEELLD